MKTFQFAAEQTYALDKENPIKDQWEYAKSSEWQNKDYHNVQVRLRGVSSDYFDINEEREPRKEEFVELEPAVKNAGFVALEPAVKVAGLSEVGVLQPEEVINREKPLKAPAVEGDTRKSRLISRTAGKWGKMRIDFINKRGRFLYIYLLIIDMSSQCLLFIFVFTYTLQNFLLSIIFLGVQHPIFDSNDDSSISTLEKLFFFSVQTMDTIGYGALAPQGRFINYMVVVTSILANCYWAAWVGILFLRFACPSSLKYTIRFSDVACINKTEWVYGGSNDDCEEKYVKGLKSLSLRLADQRPNAVVLAGNISLLYLHRQKVIGGEKEEYEFLTHELDFELNRQRGRNRFASMSTPSLSIPWKIVHVIDTISPLFGKTLEDIKAERGEIIALINATDENTSETYQARWSYCGEEVTEDQRFVQCMVYRRRGEKDCLCCDLDLLSVTTPCL